MLSYTHNSAWHTGKARDIPSRRWCLRQDLDLRSGKQMGSVVQASAILGGCMIPPAREAHCRKKWTGASEISLQDDRLESIRWSVGSRSTGYILQCSWDETAGQRAVTR